MELSFEWDEEKARVNFLKHKVSFEEGKTVFNDPFLLTFPDPEHSNSEQRYINIGVSARIRTLIVIVQNEKTIFVLSVVAKRRKMNGGSMKEKIFKSKNGEAEHDDLLPEYDLSIMKGGKRGKYYQSYRKGHTVKVHKKDGTTVIQHFQLTEGAVMLEPDVREYFPDSKAVNTALRCLIPLISKKHKAKAKT